MSEIRPWLTQNDLEKYVLLLKFYIILFWACASSECVLLSVFLKYTPWVMALKHVQNVPEIRFYFFWTLSHGILTENMGVKNFYNSKQIYKFIGKIWSCSYDHLDKVNLSQGCRTT